MGYLMASIVDYDVKWSKLRDTYEVRLGGLISLKHVN